MSLIYDRVEFLEFFDNEKIIDQEVKIAQYNLDTDGLFIFELYISPYDGFATVTLNYQKWENPIFDVGLHNIVEIKMDKQKKDYVFLAFYQENSPDPILRLPLKPTVTFQYSIGKQEENL